jgi:hypothetical protein
MINPPPISDLVQGNDKQFSFGWKQWINAAQRILQMVSNYSTSSAVVVVNGFVQAFPDNIEILQLTPAAPLAVGTVAFPADPVNGQSIRIATTRDVAAITFTSARTIANAPAALVAGEAIEYYYSLAADTWYRLA